MIGRAEVERAHTHVAAHVRRTPLLEAAGVSLKLEFLQHSGSFKARGAFHNLLTRAIPPVGVATASGGNHGAALAYAAMRLGVPAQVFVPEIAARPKVERIRSYGADVHIEGKTYFDALALCDAHVAKTGALSVHAYDSAETVAGQGTVALEWERDLAALGLPSLDTVLVAVGGGGLVSGVAAWFRGAAKIVGVEPAGSRALHAALAAGRPVDVEVKSLAADSLGARRVGAMNFEICRTAGVGVALVEDAAIREAQSALWREFNVIAEPGGAAAFAALRSGAYTPESGERVGVLLCGANADPAAFA